MADVEKIAGSIYWIGTGNRFYGSNYNPYLLIDGDDVILIDPGPVFEFAFLLSNINKIIPHKKITHIIVHNTSPSVCASLNLLFLEGVRAKIYVHERGQGQIATYGVEENIHFITETDNFIELKSGRELIFIETPYLPFYDSFMTYDTETFSLFSSSLFSGSPRKWKLHADPVFYKESLKSYHERFMPGSDFLRPVMDLIGNLQIKRVLTHRGAIIEKDVAMYIQILKGLECGIFLNPLKNDLSRKEGYINISNKVLKALCEIYSADAVREAFKDSELYISASVAINDYDGSGEELWEKMFSVIYRSKGASWLNGIKSVVDTLVLNYNAVMPKVYDDLDMALVQLDDENIKLKERNDRLEAARESLIRCPITQLYNESFLRTYLDNEVATALTDLLEFSFCRIEIDRIAEIWQKYGNKGADVKHQTLQTLAYLIDHHLQNKEHQLFKNGDDSFSLFLPHTRMDDASLIAENVRNEVSRSEQFVQPVTVSIGVTAFSQLPDDERNTDGLLDITREKVLVAKRNGMNMVCTEIEINERRNIKRVLAVDTDPMNLEILTINFMESGIEVITCNDGNEALNLIETSAPDLVISELLIPKFNGFVVRENMLSDSSQKQIPFILVSHQKDEETIRQAIDLRIQHFLQKPYRLKELVGLAQSLMVN